MRARLPLTPQPARHIAPLRPRRTPLRDCRGPVARIQPKVCAIDGRVTSSALHLPGGTSSRVLCPARARSKTQRQCPTTAARGAVTTRFRCVPRLHRTTAVQQSPCIWWPRRRLEGPSSTNVLDRARVSMARQARRSEASFDELLYGDDNPGSVRLCPAPCEASSSHATSSRT